MIGELIRLKPIRVMEGKLIFRTVKLSFPFFVLILLVWSVEMVSRERKST